MHAMIPFANAVDDNALVALGQLKLPNLTQLMRFQTRYKRGMGSEFDFLLPHEKLCQAMPDRAVLHLCHWRVGIDDIRMDDPQDLQLSAHERAELISSMQPYFAEDGLVLSIGVEQRIEVSGSAITELLTHKQLASIERVMGRHVQEWLPNLDFEGGKTLRRLQNEMQMLLYTHPVNDARADKGLPTVNSFWVSTQINWGLTPINFELRDACLATDWQQWANNWQALDNSLFRDMLARVREGETTTLSLCGERHSATYTFAKPSSAWAIAMHGLKGLFFVPSGVVVLKGL